MPKAVSRAKPKMGSVRFRIFGFPAWRVSAVRAFFVEVLHGQPHEVLAHARKFSVVASPSVAYKATDSVSVARLETSFRSCCIGGGAMQLTTRVAPERWFGSMLTRLAFNLATTRKKAQCSMGHLGLTWKRLCRPRPCMNGSAFQM